MLKPKFRDKIMTCFLLMFRYCRTLMTITDNIDHEQTTQRWILLFLSILLALTLEFS